VILIRTFSSENPTCDNSSCQIYKTHGSSWFLGNKIVKNMFVQKVAYFAYNRSNNENEKYVGISWRYWETDFQ
jgi:hypothetical protein